MEEQVLPGTTLPYYEEEGSAFLPIRKMVLQAGGFSLSQLCALTGLEGTTIQNWVKRGWIPKTHSKKYAERQVARVLLISALRDGLLIDQIAVLADSVNIPAGYGHAEQEDEQLLYDCFARTVHQLSIEEGLTEERIAAAVQTALRGFRGFWPESETWMAQVLVVMAKAYFAAVLQHRAEQHCRTLFPGGTQG